MPIIVAPMSQQRMAHDEGELAVARAVAKEDTAMVSMHVFSVTGHCTLRVNCCMAVPQASCSSCTQGMLHLLHSLPQP